MQTSFMSVNKSSHCNLLKCLLPGIAVAFLLYSEFGLPYESAVKKTAFKQSQKEVHSLFSHVNIEDQEAQVFRSLPKTLPAVSFFRLLQFEEEKNRFELLSGLLSDRKKRPGTMCYRDSHLQINNRIIPANIILGTLKYVVRLH